MWHAYDVQVPNVLVSGKCDRQRNSIEPRDQVVITPCRLPSRRVPSGQMFQFCAEHYRLYRIEPRVDAHAGVMIFNPPTELPQSATRAPNAARFGKYSPAVTVSAQVLTGIKTRSSRQPYARQALVVTARAMRLRGVFE